MNNDISHWGFEHLATLGDHWSVTGVDNYMAYAEQPYTDTAAYDTVRVMNDQERFTVWLHYDRGDQLMFTTRSLDEALKVGDILAQGRVQPGAPYAQGT